MLKKLKELLNPKLIFNRYFSIFTVAVILFWLKTYAVYQMEFDLGIDSLFQQVLLFINPISSAFLFLGLGFLFKNKRQYRAIIIIDILLSILLYANIVYYRFFNDFITLPTVLSARNNAGQLGESIASLIHVWDFVYFIDPLILIFIVLKKKVPLIREKNKKSLKWAMVIAACTFIINLTLAEIDRPQLLSRSFDRNYLVKYLGAYNFTIYDIVENMKSMTQRAMANSSEVVEVENYTKANYTEPNPEYFGIAKGKNVIFISLESLQSFIINYKLDGQEVTPFLNSLANSGEAFYFDNVFGQTGQGKTSDAEFMMDNALFPLAQGSVYTNKAQNTFQATPGILKGLGYNSAVFHGNYKTFWNRNEMYRSLGYDKFFDAEYYSMSEENTKNYGMKDIPFFKESMPMLTSLEQPFYTKFITLSNHFPFGMDPEDTTFPVGDFGDNVVDQYFQSANYLDSAIKQFFDDLKASGLYDNTIVVMYGDHYGISENHNNAMAKVLGKSEITDFDNAQLQRVPLFITVPGVKGNIIHTYSGQVDIQSTVLHLLGIDTREYLQVGSDILSKQHNDIVPFRNGSFVTAQYTYIGDKFYDNDSGELVTEVPDSEKLIEAATDKLSFSDQIINKDLLRFYTPEGFKPINRQDYQYLKPTAEELEKYKQ